MASIIRIKRSSGTSIPGALQWGELAYVTGIGSASGLNQYKDRVFLGDDGTNVLPVAGRYYTSMMNHAPGAIDGLQSTNTRNSDRGVIAILSPETNSGLGGVESLKVNQWNVDNLRLDTNTISSTDTDGDIILNPAGTGEINIVDDTFLSFGDNKDSKIEYDEDGTDQLTFTGADIRINITTESTTKDTGALIVEGGVGIEKNLNVGGTISVSGASIFDTVKIEDNIISTLPGSSNTLYLDPYPDGLSNEGTVIVKGNLQVDGRTTTINTTVTTLNDPIFNLGDVTSQRTVMLTVATGVSTVTVDSVVGVNTGDLIQGSASLPNSGLTTVTAFNSSTNIITFEGSTSAGIATLTQLTITHAYDSNTDRGISFDYNVGVGTANQKSGFFGFDDSSIADSTSTTDNQGTHADDSRRWTYIPDATITNSIVTGTKGFLDVKGVYYQSGNYATGGAVYFDSTGLQRSTNAVASPVITSKQILTAITKNTLSSLSTNISVTAGDIIRQDTTDAYGIVETTVTSSNTVDLIGVEGTFTNSYNIRREGQNGFITNLSSIPGTVTVIYTNKPSWTSTLDGGSF